MNYRIHTDAIKDNLIPIELSPKKISYVYAQLIVLANIESINAEYIKMWLVQDKRLKLLNQTAISQMKSLLAFDMKKLAQKKS